MGEEAAYLAWLKAADGMSVRLKNALLNACNGNSGWYDRPMSCQIDTFAKLTACRSVHLLRLRNFGRKTLHELRAVLDARGLHMADDTPAERRMAARRASERAAKVAEWERRRKAKASHKRCRCPWCQGG